MEPIVRRRWEIVGAVAYFLRSAWMLPFESKRPTNLHGLCSDRVLIGLSSFALQMAFVNCHLLAISVAMLGVPIQANAELPISVSYDDVGHWTYTWGADSEFINELHLETSIPSVFNGANVAGIVGATSFYNGGIYGQNTISSNIEAGHIWDGHQSLGHVVSFTNHTTAPRSQFSTPAYDRHATLVGMMIGGRQGGTAPGGHQVGIAPQTDLRSGAIAVSWASPAYALSFFTSTNSQAFPYAAGAVGFGTADVINSSWGALGGAQGFERQGRDIRSMVIDGLANANPLTTFVASAGNGGLIANTVGAPGSGYNGITVGALANDGNNNYFAVASFSSRGPQDYGDPVNGRIPASAAQRAVVDLVAPGTDLVSAYYGGQSGGNDASLTNSEELAGTNRYGYPAAGTSFAAPIVAGGVALMASAAKTENLDQDARDARVVKANLLNAAWKIPGWDNGQVDHSNGNGGVLTTQALDFTSGAGALDLDRTYTQYLAGQTGLPGLDGGTTSQTIGWDYAEVAFQGTTDVVISTPLAGGTEFRATLSWFRERAYTNPTSQSDIGFANLDLQIWDSTFTTLFSESTSLYTPVEHLAFELPQTGTYGIRVHYAGNIFGNLQSEQFGIAWYGVPVPEPGALWLLLSAAAFASARTTRTRRHR